MAKTTVNVTQSGGIGVAVLLGVPFIALKLLGLITWSWLWVLAPFWIGTAIAISILAIVALFALLIAILSAFAS